jgi:hypothetical protein
MKGNNINNPVHGVKKLKLMKLGTLLALSVLSLGAVAGCSNSQAQSVSHLTVNDIHDDFDIIGNPASTEGAYKKAVSQEIAVFKDCYDKAKAKGEAVKDYFSNHPLCHAFQTGLLGLGSTNQPSEGSKYFVSELQKVQTQLP